LGYRTTLSYDAAGRQTAVTNTLGYTSTTIYDVAGQTAAVMDPLGNRTSYSYDIAGTGTEKGAGSGRQDGTS